MSEYIFDCPECEHRLPLNEGGRHLKVVHPEKAEKVIEALDHYVMGEFTAILRRLFPNSIWRPI